MYRYTDRRQCSYVSLGDRCPNRTRTVGGYCPQHDTSLPEDRKEFEIIEAVVGNKETLVAEILSSMETEGEILHLTNRLRNKNGSSLLHIAAACGNVEICSLLLKRGAEVNSIDMEGRTPLHQAALYGHQSVCRLLFDHDAKVLTDRRGLTPFHEAALFGDTAFDLFLKRNHYLNSRSAVSPFQESVVNTHCARNKWRNIPLPLRNTVKTWLLVTSRGREDEVEDSMIRATTRAWHLPLDVVEKIVLKLVSDHVRSTCPLANDRCNFVSSD